MFEAEVQMEERSSVLPLLLLLCLAAVLVGVVGYVVYQVRETKDLSAAEATPIVTASLNAEGPAMIHFHGGFVKPSVDEKTRDPHYKLLEKAGIITLATGKDGSIRVALTPAGEHLVTTIPGFRQDKNADGTSSYFVPLAQRQLVDISKVTMSGVNSATVEYTWKWVPNRLGDDFDAAGSLVKSFNTWDRSTLIDKYGADFYHGNPARASLMLTRTEKGWKIAEL
jgi:hypothetical protein